MQADNLHLLISHLIIISLNWHLLSNMWLNIIFANHGPGQRTWASYQFGSVGGMDKEQRDNFIQQSIFLAYNEPIL